MKMVSESKIADQLSLIKAELTEFKSSVRGQEILLRLLKDEIAIIKQEQRDLTKRFESLEKFTKDNLMGTLEKVLGELRKLEDEMKIRAYQRRGIEERVEKLEHRYAVT